MPIDSINLVARPPSGDGGYGFEMRCSVYCRVQRGDRGRVSRTVFAGCGVCTQRQTRGRTAAAARCAVLGVGPRHLRIYKKLTEKVAAAKQARDIEIVGFLWLQGGGDMKKADVASEYLDNLKSLVAAVRKETGVADLPFVYGTTRIEGIPDDLTGFQEPPTLPPGRLGAFLVLKAQFDARKAIPHSTMVILRNIEKHPKNVHYNTAGQLNAGKLFAEAFLDKRAAQK